MKQSIDVGLEAITDADADSNIEHGSVLAAFAEAVVGRDEAEIAKRRQAVIDTAGEAEMIDAAGVASNFERMVRIADGIGIPLDEGLVSFSEKTREQLDLNRWHTN